MQQLTRYCAGWVVAASIATSVSYAAIQNLVVTAALGQPVHLSVFSKAAPTPVATQQLSPPPTPSASTGATHRAGPAQPVAHRTPASAPTTRLATPVRTVAPVKAVAAPTSPAHGYSLTGGQVTLKMNDTSAQLVSAVPAAGYQTETWHTDYWIRVDFVSGDQRSSLIVSWFEHAPLVETSES